MIWNKRIEKNFYSCFIFFVLSFALNVVVVVTGSSEQTAHVFQHNAVFLLRFLFFFQYHNKKKILEFCTCVFWYLRIQKEFRLKLEEFNEFLKHPMPSNGWNICFCHYFAVLLKKKKVDWYWDESICFKNFNDDDGRKTNEWSKINQSIEYVNVADVVVYFDF